MSSGLEADTAGWREREEAWPVLPEGRGMRRGQRSAEAGGAWSQGPWQSLDFILGATRSP